MCKKFKKSFSLIELSIVITILSIISSISFNSVNTLLKQSKIAKNTQKINLIKRKLNDYFTEHKRLPKPADYLISISSNEYGKEKIIKSSYDIEVDGNFYSTQILTQNNNEDDSEIKHPIKYIMYRGIIPFKTLNLKEEDIIDVYGNYFEYYVPDIMTLNEGDTPYYQEGLIKEGYKLKYKDYGMYSEYPCFGIQDKTPDNLCLKTNNILYGVHFIELNYQPIKFIEFYDSSQIINLGIKSSNDIIIQVKYKYKRCNNSIFIGNSTFRFFCGNDNLTYFINNDISISDTYINQESNNIYETEFGLNNGSMYVYDLNGIKNFSIKNPSQNNKDENMQVYSDIYITGQENVELYSIKIYKKSELIGNFIPVYLKTNITNEQSQDNNIHYKDEVGLWNLVTNQFHANNSQITLNKGFELPIETTKHYIQHPYGFHIKNTKNNKDFYTNGSVAYVIVSHGENGKKTCNLSYNKKTSNIEINNFFNYSSIKNEQTKEAQNCIDAKTTNDIIGRTDFMNDINKEFTFYKGDISNEFDDIIEVETLSNLVLNK